MNKKIHLGILISGRGSNLKAILQKSMSCSTSFIVSVVVSNNHNAVGLKVADNFYTPNYFVDRGNYDNKGEFENVIKFTLEKHHVDLVILAGYMNIVGKVLLSSYPGKILNIHPSLLPAFPGLNAQKQALDYGVQVTGCTAHFVDKGMDTGKIIMQEAVNILESDTVETLSNEILKKEHILYSRAITQVCCKLLRKKGK